MQHQVKPIPDQIIRASVDVASDLRLRLEAHDGGAREARLHGFRNLRQHRHRAREARGKPCGLTLLVLVHVEIGPLHRVAQEYGVRVLLNGNPVLSARVSQPGPFLLTDLREQRGDIHARPQAPEEFHSSAPIRHRPPHGRSDVVPARMERCRRLCRSMSCRSLPCRPLPPSLSSLGERAS